MPLQATSGAASYDAFGGGVPVVPNYIEDVFSTYLYTGNGSTQTITNGIDLSTKGGLVWIKNRSDTGGHRLFDTARGVYNWLSSNSTGAQQDASPYGVTAFNSNGFAVSDSGPYAVNDSGQTYASWTFRKQPKFFDVVTYTGNGVAGRAISHNLGSTPGFIAVKKTSNTGDWLCYHQARPAKYFYLNSTAAEGDDSTGVVWGNGTTAVAPTSTNFTVNALTAFPSADINKSGETYVAYLFAHDAGGFGLTGTDNVISCGSFTSDALGQASVTLNYEPQWVMIKRTDGTSNWTMLDNMRGWAVTSSGDAALQANTSNAETSATEWGYPTATGFSVNEPNGSATYIYIAIRRGPMAVPTSGTSVFAPALGVSTTPNMVAGFPVDSFLGGDRDTSTSTNWKWWDRLRGNVASLLTTTTAAEDTSEYNYGQFQSMTGFISGNYDASDKIGWLFRRAPSFFDEVCYTGTGSAVQTYSHNLGVAPELMIVKCRNDAGRNWTVYSSALGNGFRITLQQSLQAFSTTVWNSTSPTATQFTVTSDPMVGANTFTYVNYLFATCAGVSKVGSYTGTGTTKQVDCGFTGGARFVLIKRTDDVGDWYVWDSARGIVSGNDPYLLLNSTAAEVTSTDYIDTYSAGFEISSTAPAAINASGGTFIFLAIA